MERIWFNNALTILYAKRNKQSFEIGISIWAPKFLSLNNLGIKKRLN